MVCIDTPSPHIPLRNAIINVVKNWNPLSAMCSRRPSNSSWDHDIRFKVWLLPEHHFSQLQIFNFFYVSVQLWCIEPIKWNSLKTKGKTRIWVEKQNREFSKGTQSSRCYCHLRGISQHQYKIGSDLQAPSGSVTHILLESSSSCCFEWCPFWKATGQRSWNEEHSFNIPMGRNSEFEINTKYRLGLNSVTNIYFWWNSVIPKMSLYLVPLENLKGHKLWEGWMHFLSLLHRHSQFGYILDIWQHRKPM